MNSNLVPNRVVEPLLDSRHTAELLGICTRKLWSLVDAGEIKAVRIGRAVRFDPADIRRFIDASKGAQP